MMSFAAWWVILATGRLPYGMFEVMEPRPSLPGAGAGLLAGSSPTRTRGSRRKADPSPRPWGIQMGIEPAPE